MAKLTSIQRKDLSVQDFVSYPIWAWDETQEWLNPIDEFSTLPEEYGTLFVKSKFKSADGIEFSGYLVGTLSFYAFGLFVDGQEIVINLNLPDMAQESVQEIERIMGLTELHLFPISYESEIKCDDGSPIQGLLVINQQSAVPSAPSS